MNRIDKLFVSGKEDILSIYFTAGFPGVNDTLKILRILEREGADMVEIGIPFSDPLADGPTIQGSNKTALDNGMSLTLLFQQLQDIRKKIRIPVLLMGYFNQILRFGVEKFCSACCSTGIDGVIIPDLPPAEYEKRYKDLFDGNGLSIPFLITPQSSESRVRMIDRISNGFIYMVSSPSVTGETQLAKEKTLNYFRRIQAMDLKSPRLIGFGIFDRESFALACRYARGAIIGSAFIRAVSGEKSLEHSIPLFIQSIRS